MVTKEQALENIKITLKDKEQCNIPYDIGANILGSISIIENSFKALDILQAKEAKEKKALEDAKPKPEKTK